MQLHSHWKTQNQASFNPVPNLVTHVLPVLDNLTPLLLLELEKNENNNLDAHKRI